MATAVNYTPEMTVELVEAYKAEPTKATIEAFATKFGKNAKSIVAKLAKEGVYKSEAKASGGKRVTKEDLVTGLANLLGVPRATLESLEKATMPALMVVAAVVSEAKRPVADATVAEVAADATPAADEAVTE